ncbi:cobalamin synthesis protein [Aureococcus anophagefferens]|uniref:Cobalamin synthesis protein n=1 Tax=Aureococcus anophagefferens TaxID=44056 RepID=A0ABR1G2Z2_AURAN
MSFVYGKGEGPTARDPFDKEWWRNVSSRQAVVKQTGSLWADQSIKRRKPKPITFPEPWAGPGLDRVPVVVEHGVTPPPAGGGGVRHHAVFDFGTRVHLLRADGDFQALLKRLHPEGIGCVVVETTGTSDPALFARILFQDQVLLAKFALRSILAVFDARTVEAQLAKPDRPGAKNPHRLQLLSADRVLLSHGGDCGGDGGAPRRAAAAARGDGRGRRGRDAAYDAVRPCRFVKAMVSFAPSDGVLNAVCILEQGFVYEKQLRDLAARLGGALRCGEICRFKAAGLLRLPTGRLEGVLLDGSLDRCDEARVPVDPAAAARGPRSAFEVMDEAADDSKLGEAGDWAPDVGAPCVRLFVIGKRLNAAALRAAVRATVIPEGFVYAADEELDFGLFTDGDDAADDPLSRLIAGAPAEPKTELTVDLDGAAVTLFRRPDGGYAAKRDGNDAELEVIKMFASALYVSLPDVASLPAPPPVM